MTTMPHYIHLPLKFMWFDREEVWIACLFYVIANVVGTWLSWAFVLLGPLTYMHYKKGKPRGFLQHVIMTTGVSQLKRYPPYHYQSFEE